MNPVRYDAGPYPRARIAFLCVANAGLTEGEMHAMAPKGVGLSFGRVPMATACSVQSLAGMEGGLRQALDSLVPGRRDIDVLCYNCTAGSFVIGNDKVRTLLAQARPGSTATTLLDGVAAALAAVGARRLAIATAYDDEVNALERACFEGAGHEVVSLQGLALPDDETMNRVSPDYLYEFACAVDRPDADAVFISCGALRSTAVIERLEARLGKPVIGSNQASMWHCLRLAGIDDRMDGYGRLFREH
ncbi:arylmalonate decarboxylase [Achromobacter sp. SD115]|uniref:maleate cis-trans isomerase family protein n=1 Tax=Achromobacter sp. SD115 TaxID=2782011 RepID=UPI001A959A85|nr:arylmalonate decarboxylase [Achromobacter sp. SD115]MBO1015807.1 arylmalonate decarboxylase [Achromobacter sp. SD115]